MYSILILSHGGLAKEFLNTSKLIMGEQDHVLSLGLDASESRENYQSRLIEACEQLKNRDGILVLADLFGGTPSNAAILSLFERYPNLQMIAGLNLALLIEALMLRTYRPLDEAVEILQEAGRQGIVDIKKQMAKQEEE